MGETPNHEYNLPEQGTADWHEPLNENFEAIDLDVEVWTSSGNRDQYDPTEGARLLETDTGVLYAGTGSEWEPQFAVGYVTEDSGVVFDEGVTITGNLEASGTKHFVQQVETDAGPREVVYTAAEAATPRTETSGVAQLEDGRAVVGLPDHFGWVTSETEPLLIQTTPYAAASAGLAVVERSPDRLVVEDRSGEGDYEFAYTVRGTREGYADRPVVRSLRETTGDTRATGDGD